MKIRNEKVANNKRARDGIPYVLVTAWRFCFCARCPCVLASLPSRSLVWLLGLFCLCARCPCVPAALLLRSLVCEGVPLWWWTFSLRVDPDLFKGNPQSLRGLRIRTVTDCTVEPIYSYPHTKKSKDLVLATLVPKPAKTWSFQRLTCVAGLSGNK